MATKRILGKLLSFLQKNRCGPGNKWLVNVNIYHFVKLLEFGVVV